jgi:hypothetical protein
MKIIKYLGVFLVIYIISQFFLAMYHDSKLDLKKVKPSLATKYNQKQITRIELPSVIELGTLKGNEIEGEFKVKNIGNYDLTELSISGDCSCTTIEFSSKDLAKGKSSIVYYKIDLSEENGWFNKTITLQGSFYPYKRFVSLEGYKM